HVGFDLLAIGAVADQDEVDLAPGPEPLRDVDQQREAVGEAERPDVGDGEAVRETVAREQGPVRGSRSEQVRIDAVVDQLDRVVGDPARGDVVAEGPRVDDDAGGAPVEPALDRLEGGEEGPLGELAQLDDGLGPEIAYLED